GLAGEADLEVRGGRSGFSESLYPAIARLPGVAAVSPGLELDAALAGTERSIRVIGIDALRERRPELLASDKVLLSAAAAELVKGDRLRLVIGQRTIELQVGGVLAMVALFTGGFLVFSAQALEVARRRGEHALLRVLGLQRRGVLQLVLLEAAALGAIGGLLGLGVGYALALAAVRASGADLGAG